jgi:hypothetical protein
MNYNVLLVKTQLDDEENTNKIKSNDDMITLFSFKIDLKELIFYFNKKQNV